MNATRSRLRKSAGIISVIVSAVAVSAAVAAPVSAATTSVPDGWNATGAATGCPAGVRLLAPAQPTAFYAAHPEALVPPGGGRAGAGILRTARRNADARLHWRTELTCRPGHPGRPVQPARQRAAGTTANGASTNWSGYVTNNGPGYLGAAMEWLVPSVDPSNPNNAQASIWPGIGTGNSTTDTLVQAGTQQTGFTSTSCTKGSCVSQWNALYSFWFETFPQEPEQEITNLTASPGDDVSAIAEYDPVSGQAYFELADYTTNEGVYYYQPVTGSAIGSGSQAEWIIERPETCNLGCSWWKLQNFGNEPIINAQAVEGSTWDQVTYADAAGTNPASMTLYDCAGDQLAGVGPITGFTDFTTSWLRYGNFDNAPC
ncbi:hypothetical protein CF165_28020 [Amycolatopsis vastitatis]|uniref:Peptidase A4 family protein n=1 Tax=Amycolatopsis vastitatis TaxID=1905142 RepID=A0A229SZY6_9PSEU|nr:hypothetical protein CF165_28020 [Amycolatopsis vastitatis]